MSYSAVFEHPAHVESIKIAGDYRDERGCKVNIGLVGDRDGRKHVLFFDDFGLLHEQPFRTDIIVAVNDDSDIPF